MRLRLCINRPGLPTVRLLWSVGRLRPNSEASGSSHTIAQLLAQVNDVFPLEFEDRGLEGYAVEVHGFECLHFCKLDQILRDEDQVTIRPLEALDVRERSLSRRTKVTQDGRHLIDGVAFGRPFLKRPAQLPLEIAPYKRTKTQLRGKEGEDNGENDEEREEAEHLPTSQELVLQSMSLDEDYEEASTSDSNEDDEFHSLEDGNMTKELEGLAEEQDLDESPAAIRGIHEQWTEEKSAYGSLTSSRKRRRAYGLGIGASNIPNALNECGVRKNRRNRIVSEAQWKAVHGKRVEASDGARATSARYNHAIAKDGSRRSSRSSTKSVRFEQSNFETPATILENASQHGSDSSDDEDFVPENASRSTESNKENITPMIKETRQDNSSLESASSSDTSESESESDSETSSDSVTDSDTDTSSDDEGDEPESELPSPVAITASDSTSATSSSEDGEDQDKIPQLDVAHKNGHVMAATPRVTDKARDLQIPKAPPGGGKTQTQKRNQRRRWTKKLKYLKLTGQLPESATLGDCIAWYDQSGNDKYRVEPAGDLESRRQALLSAVEAGGVHVETADPQSGDTILQKETRIEGPLKERLTQSDSNNAHAHSGTTSDSTPLETQTETMNTPVKAPDQITTAYSEPIKRRAKLDLAGSRRLLFGSLGLKAPKSKADEDALRTKLTANVKSIALNPRLQPASESAEIAPIDENTWRDKIALKAVECCYNGVGLSEPPFPFVQRWDKSQRGPYGQNGVDSKKRKRNNQQALPDDGHKQDDLVGQQSLNYNESEMVIDQGEMPQELAPSQKDLPTITSNMSLYSPLQLSRAVHGTIIAFKHLELSAATNWQPVQSGYRTAKIEQILENGNLELTLALRDRTSASKDLDPMTGERTYSKFEMPGAEETDDGFLALNFAEMEDPRVIQAAQSPETKGELDTQPESPQAEAEAEPEVEQRQSPGPQQLGETSFQSPVAASPVVEGDEEKDRIQETREAAVGEADIVMTETTEHETENEVSDQARKDISALIKEAGFHSDVASEVHGSLRQTEDCFEREDDDGYPEFEGFTSSPPEVRSSSIANDTGDVEFAGGAETVDGIGGSDYVASTQNYHHIDDGTEGRLPPPSSVAKMIAPGDDDSEDNWQPQHLDDTMEGDHDPESINAGYDGPHNSENAEVLTSPPPTSKFHESASVRLDSVDQTDQSETPIKRSTRKSYIASSPISPPQRMTRNRLSQPTHQPTSSVVGSDVSDDLPSLNNLLSQSQPIKKSERAFESQVPPPSATAPPRAISQKYNKDIMSLRRSSSPLQEISNLGSGLNSPAMVSQSNIKIESSSQPVLQPLNVSRGKQLGSNIVDLTLTSDPISPDDSEYDETGSSLPSGPGWVKKLRSSSHKEQEDDDEGVNTRSRSYI